MILNIMDAAHDIDNRAAIAKSNFRNKKLAICTRLYPEIGRFPPVSVQKLLVIDLERVEERVARGNGICAFEDESVRCYCKHVTFL